MGGRERASHPTAEMVLDNHRFGEAAGAPSRNSAARLLSRPDRSQRPPPTWPPRPRPHPAHNLKSGLLAVLSGLRLNALRPRTPPRVVAAVSQPLRSSARRDIRANPTRLCRTLRFAGDSCGSRTAKRRLARWSWSNRLGSAAIPSRCPPRYLATVTAGGLATQNSEGPKSAKAETTLTRTVSSSPSIGMGMGRGVSVA